LTDNNGQFTKRTIKIQANKKRETARNRGKQKRMRIKGRKRQGDI
jgi:hypothetical protein